MVVTGLELRSFRNIERALIPLGPGITVVHGPNGAGKTNLLEGLHFALTGRSPRTNQQRDLIRFDDSLARAVACVSSGEEVHEWSAAVERSGARHLRRDGAARERVLSGPPRPRLVVFLPEGLELIKGAPGPRRDHVDAFTGSLWPGRRGDRSLYGAALGQRNALLGRIRAGEADPSALGAWDAELAGRGWTLIEGRREAVASLQGPFEALSEALGLPAPAELRYRPRSRAASPEELRGEFGTRREDDLARGFTGHGPHRDDLDFEAGGRSLRRFGSQGQQRTALLCLLLAERRALALAGEALPLLLLDDVLSELDQDRRRLLLEQIGDGGQALVTTTDTRSIPEGIAFHPIEMRPGRPLQAVATAA